MNPFSNFREIRFACLRMRTAEAARELETLLNGDAEPKRYSLRSLSGPIDWEGFRSAVSGAQPLKAVLWTPTNEPEHCALMANRSDGLAHTLKVFARAYPREVFRVSSRDSEGDACPGRVFAHYANRLQIEREVAAVMDSDRWKFVATGEAQGYEDVEMYKRSRIAERLTRDAIRGYLLKLGFAVASDHFWAPVGEHAVIEQIRVR